MTQKVLVPVGILEGQTVDPGVIEVLADESVVLLGYHIVPEQTAPDQARESFANRANAKLDDIQAAFEEAGASVERSLVFTHDREQTFERVAEETEADAIVHLGPAMEAERLLVVLHPEALAGAIARFVADLVSGTDREVVLLSLVTDEEVASASMETAQEILEESGVGASQITTERNVTESHIETITDAVTGCDMVVMGEREPALSELLLGDFEERLARESLGPVFVVRTVETGD